jgi:hypothetical protein
MLEAMELGGLEKAYSYFFAKVWNAQLKFLRDGRKHVTRIHQQNATPVEGQDGAYNIALHVRHWLADPTEAEVGEYVYERSLRANDDVDAVTQQPKASHLGREFVRTDDGWCRMI